MTGRPAPGTYGHVPPGLDPRALALFEAARPLLDTRSNDVHAAISCQYVVEFLGSEGGDPAVAVPAILLHDVGWHEIPEEDQRRAYGPGSSDAEANRRHEIAGAREARRLLEQAGYPEDQRDEIVRIIRTHDSVPAAETVEEAVVKDADKVWRVSRIGFPLTLGLLGDLSPQELHDFIAIRVERWFLTDSGREAALRELAERRAEFGLDDAPDVPAPPGYGIGDAQVYS